MIFIGMKSGIYKIICRANGKFYVGSTNDLVVRWQTHRARLRGGKHENAHLQNAWNKYGESTFGYEVVEYVPENKLFDIEQGYLDRLGAYERKIGFNLSCTARGPVTDKLVKEYIVTLPSGEEMYVKNLLKFCRERGIGTCGGLHQVARGLTNQCDGYRARYASQSKDEWQCTLMRPEKHGPGWKGKYKVTCPDGKVIVVLSLTKFCKEKGLSQGNMAAICRGERAQHKGYRCEYLTCTQEDT